MRSWFWSMLSHFKILPDIIIIAQQGSHQQQPTEQHRMPYPLPTTQSSRTLRIITATSECCFSTSVQYLMQSHPWNSLENLTLSWNRIWILDWHSQLLYLQVLDTSVLSPLLFTLHTHDRIPACRQHHHHRVHYEQWRKLDLWTPTTMCPVFKFTHNIRPRSVFKYDLSLGKIYGFFTAFCAVNCWVTSVLGKQSEWLSDI